MSAEFRLYLIKEFQRLKEEESLRLETGWDIRRTLARINYRIHTDAIKDIIVPQTITQQQSRPFSACSEWRISVTVSIDPKWQQT